MSSRARAAQYSAQVSERNKARRSRPDNFSTKKAGPPTYAFQDQQRGQVDDIADESAPTRNALKEQQDDEDEDHIDHSSAAPAKSTGKVRPAQKTTAASAAPPPQLKSAFMKCWTTVDEQDIPAYSEDSKSSWIPNAIKIFLILFQMELLLCNNEELKWVSPNYFSLPVRLYYSVIFYVQVLRAKEQAGALTKSEGSWLRAFFRRYKDTLLPIAGPLVPVFSNIISVLPPDARFDYVYPSFNGKGGYQRTKPATGNPVLTVDAEHFLLPSPILLLSLFHHYAAKAAGSDVKKSFEDGAFVPWKVSVGGYFGHHEIDASTTNGAKIHLLSNIVIDAPLPEDDNYLAKIHGFWKRSALYKKSASPLTNVAFEPKTVGDLCLMTENFEWFQPCVDMANVQVKFFTDSTTLSSIPTVGGCSALVDCRLDIKDLAGQTETTGPTTFNAWYPGRFSNIEAGYRSLDAELTIDEKYNAMFSNTNAKISWSGTKGKYIGSFTEGQREGPYFENATGKVQYLRTDTQSITSNLYSMIQTEFYQYDAKA